MIIEIGNKSLKDLTSNNLMDIIKIIGCIPSPKYWNFPVLLDFSNTMFSNTIVIDYTCYRKSDNKKSCDYTFFFQFESFTWHYTKDYERLRKTHRHHSSKLGLPELRYLITQGFDVPLY